MSNIVFLNRQTLGDTADAIRGKLGTTDSFYPSEMADAILSISSADKPSALVNCKYESGYMKFDSTSKPINITNSIMGGTYFNTLTNGLSNSPFSVELYFDATYNCTVFNFGNSSVRNCFSFSTERLVCYSDDHSWNANYVGKHHVVITYDGNVTIKAYHNGEYTQTITLGGALKFINSPYVTYGAWLNSTTTAAMEGEIYRTRIYDKELSGEEISELYLYEVQ